MALKIFFYINEIYKINNSKIKISILWKKIWSLTKNISLPKLFLNKRVKLKKKELKFIKTS